MHPLHNIQLGQHNMISASFGLFGVSHEDRERIAQARVPETDDAASNNGGSRRTGGTPTLQWIHLACHGQQNLRNLFESRFSLQAKPLTLLEDFQARFPNAESAFMSACHSAKGYPTAPDTGLHVVGALAYVLLGSGVGLLWAMDDRNGPNVAEAFYRHVTMPPPTALGSTCAHTHHSIMGKSHVSADDGSSMAQRGEAQREETNLMSVVTAGCGAKYQDLARPAKDVLGVQLVLDLFVRLALGASSDTPTLGGSAFVAAAALASLSPSAGPSTTTSCSPYGFPTASLVPLTPAQSALPMTPPLVTSAYVLQHLPGKPFRSLLWREFEPMMVLLSSAPGIKTLESWVKAWFAWAEANSRVAAAAGGGRQDEGDIGRGVLTAQGSRAKRNSMAQGGSPSTSLTVPSGTSYAVSPSAPTLSIFALACAALALDAQSHAVKLAHGFLSELGQNATHFVLKS